MSDMNAPLVDLPPVNLTNAQIIALLSVSVAVVTVSLPTVRLAPSPRTFISTPMRKALRLFKEWKIKCNESNHISDSQDGLEN